MSSRKRAALAVAVVGVLVAGFGSGARAQDAPKTTGEKIKEGFSGAASAVGSAGRKVADSVKATFARTKDSVHNMGVEARVYGRLHWDKALSGPTSRWRRIRTAPWSCTGSSRAPRRRSKRCCWRARPSGSTR